MTIAQEVAVLIPTLSSFPIAAVITDQSGAVRWANAAFENLTRYKLDEICGSSIELLTPAGTVTSLQQVLHSVASGESWEGESVCAGSDGADRTMEQTASPVRDGSNTITHILWTLRRKIHNAERHEQPEKIISAAQLAVGFGVFRWDARTGKSLWSPETYALYGLDAAAEASFDAWLQTVHEDHRKRILREFQQTLDSADGRMDIEYLSTDGGRWIAGYGQLYRSAQGDPDHMIGINLDITERKQMEEDQRLASVVLRNINDGVFLVRRSDGIIVYANRQSEAICGYARGEMIGMRISALDAPVDKTPEECSAEIIEVLSKEGTWSGDLRSVRKDGSIFWGAVDISEYEHVQFGHVWLVVYSDITNRVEQAEFVERVFNSTVDHLAVVDRDGRIVRVNDAWRRFAESQGAGDEIFWGVGASYFRTCTPEAGDTYAAREAFNGIRDVQTGKLPRFEIEYPCHAPDQQRWFQMRVLPLVGHPGSVLVAHANITERKRMEAEMRTLITAIESAEEPIMVTDAAGDIEYCNPAFEKVTGYPKREVVGRNPRILSSGKNPEVYRDLWRTITGGNVWRGRFTNRKKNGTLYEEDASIAPIRGESGQITGFVAVKRDVTEYLQLERQLLHAQKLETVGRLAGGLAHDFNNLLTVINGYSDFLLKRLDASEPLRRHAEQIRTAGERAAGLTRQLLAFSRKQVIEPRILDLNAVIGESVPLVARLLGEDIVLNTRLDAFLGKVLSDPGQIQQVIMNLATNARDAMPNGGRLDIRTADVYVDEGSAAAIHPEMPSGRYVLMSVSDTGHGIPEAIRQQIFEPFFTTKEPGKGTGLGLSTVYGIVRQSGGWIDVSSEAGAGTCFRVYLPRTEGSPVPAQKPVEGQSAGGHETVLLVEDQDAVRAFVRAALEQYGYNVLEAAEGQAALAIARQHPQRIHLLLTDVVLPGMNGKELSERLQALRPDMKVIFTSGYTADVIGQRGVLLQGTSYLPKPFGADELAAKVRSILGAPATG